MGCRRICRCHPYSNHYEKTKGYDPVPQKIRTNNLLRYRIFTIRPLKWGLRFMTRSAMVMSVNKPINIDDSSLK